MANKKSKENPHRWPNGTWHSRPYYGGDGKKDPPKKAEAVARMTPPSASQNANTTAASILSGIAAGTIPVVNGRVDYAAIGGPAKPGQVYVPPTAGVPSDPVQPFMTADDMILKGDKQHEWASAIAEIDAMLADMEANIGHEKTNIDKARIKGVAQTQDDMAARGLFQSSIKDVELFDIEATTRLRKDFLDTQFSNAVLAAGRQKGAIQGAQNSFQVGLDQRMVENAQSVQAQNPWKIAPTEGRWASPNELPPPQSPPMGQSPPGGGPRVSGPSNRSSSGRANTNSGRGRAPGRGRAGRGPYGAGSV